MHIRKKIYPLIMLCIILTAAQVLCGCKKNDIAPEDMVDILLITDIGTINDGSYNEGPWNGVNLYSQETGEIAKYYKPNGTTTEDYLEQIKIGVDNGAKVIVCPGSLFGEAVFKAQKTYKDVDFIILDGIPHNEDYSDETIMENVMSIQFSEEEAGFLAGYAAVRDGYSNLAFMGGIAEEPVIRFGYGFVQGADYAAIQMGTPVSIRYTYTNTYFDDSSVEATAASWYDNGTEVIFSCGGAIGSSIMRAAENHNGKVIGVDIDQADSSYTVITSATKSLDSAVYHGLMDYHNGTFKGGLITKLGAKDNGIGLPLDTSRFSSFQFEDYQEIYQLLSDGVIVPYSGTEIGTCEELTLVNTEVSYIVP